MSTSPAEIERCHQEVADALRAAAPGGDTGERIRTDRGSTLPHLGLRTPARRKLVKAGFSFYDLDETALLAVWDGIWHTADSADVMFAVLDYYRERLKVRVPPGFWTVAKDWIDRVDNWAHADDLARVYSWVLAANHEEVYPSLVTWNQLDSEWHRRVSIVSLIHYSGKNAVFVPPGLVFPLIESCLSDPRPGIQKAVGWVLREMAGTYEAETIAFLKLHQDQLSPTALRRATERLDPTQQAAVRHR